MSRSLADYRLLGRSGLRVSPLSLGTMTFGEDWGWGAGPEEARRILDTYLDRGGNFVDTSVNYTDGSAERLLGRFVKDRRDQVVLSTKYTMTRDRRNPNAGGNHRLNMVRSLEASLRRLDTDHIDLFYLHGWDYTTAHEEVMRGLDDLVRSGKITYVGIANTPAWRISAMQTLADLRGWTPLVALQSEYSLVQRTVEHELLPMAFDLGLGVLPWSALGGGLLTGKYGRADVAEQAGQDAAVGTRRGVIQSSGNLTDRNVGIADAVQEVAAQVGASAAQVAIAWTLLNPAVVSPVLGARTARQLEDNLGALDVVLDREHVERLDAVSDPGRTFPRAFMDRPMAQGLIFGDARVAGRRGL
ncbi:aldo/keto reductase [Nocardiopsis sediminis]|uniref:Aldo/keto reductase n=1 Tax=Nocardiopsis sediminis TaxID=1778267 RepID=A0ABV8FJ14_9ACTN